MNIGDLFVRVLGDTSQVERDVAGLGTSPKIAAGGRKAGDMFANGVRQASNLIGPAIGAAFAGGISSAAKFQDQLQTIRTVAMDLTDQELAGIGDELLTLSAKTGKPIEDLTAGFYDLVSAGIDASDGVKILAESSNLAIGGLGSTAQAVDLVTSVLNAYGLEADQASRVTDVFAKAVADGKVTTAQLGESIATIAPIAAQAGISIEEVSSGFAVLTAQGVPAAEAATKMRSAIVALISPNEALNRIQARTGINFAKLAREKGLAVALEKLREVTGAAGSTFNDFSSELAATKGTVDDARTIVEKFQRTLGLTDAQAAEFVAAVGKDGMGQALSDLARKLGAGDAAFADSLGRVEAYGFALATTGDNAAAFGDQIEETLATTGLASEQAAIKMDSPVEAGKRLAAELNTLSIRAFGPFANSLGPLVIALDQFGGAMRAIVAPSRLVGGAIGFIVQRLVASTAVQGALRVAGAAGGAAYRLAFTTAAYLGGFIGSLAETLSGTGPIRSIKSAAAKLGGAWKVAFITAAAVLWYEVVLISEAQKAEIANQGQEIGAALAEQIAHGTTEQLQQSRGAFIAGLDQLETYPMLFGVTKAAEDELKRNLAAVEAELMRRGGSIRDRWYDDVSDLGGTLADGVEDGIGPTGKAADDLGDALEDPLSDAASDSEKAISDAVDGILKKLKDARTELSNAASNAAHAIYDPIIAQANLAATEREIAEQQQVASSKDSSAEQIQDAKDRLVELQIAKIGYLAELAGYGDQAAADTLETQIKVLESVKGLTTEQKLYLAELRRQLRLTREEADKLTHSLGHEVKPYVPPRGAPVASASGGYLDPGVYRFGERGSEVVTVAEGYHGLAIPEGVMAGGMASQTFQTTLIMPGPSTRDPFAIFDRASQLQRFGVLNPEVKAVEGVIRG